MTMQDKLDWLAKATIEELLDQYVSLIKSDRYGVNYEDIKITKEEIIRRTTK